MPPIQTPNTLWAPTRDVLVDEQRMASKTMYDWMQAINTTVGNLQPLLITRFGARGNGLADDTNAFVQAMDFALRQGGGTILVPPGQYKISSFQTPPGTVPITILGQGDSSVLVGSLSAPSGQGHIDVRGSHFRLDSLAIDGNRTTPIPLYYNVDFNGIGGNDPMAPSLSDNSSVRVHGGISDFQCERVLFTHAAGYSALIDAGEPGGITDVSFVGCRFENNRQSLFGVGAFPAIYGGWGGCVYVNGDGRTGFAGRVLKRFIVSRCKFLRNTGNCLWSHLFGLEDLHEDFQFTDNYFLDCGLDGILVGGVTGGVVNGNVFRRVGYVTLTDSDLAVPRWLAGVQATALDSSGLVKSVPYTNNSMLSVNGGQIDMDGHGFSVIANNVCRIPVPGEVEYDEDSIAISGASNAGSTSYGVNTNNSNQTPYGAADLNITGNLFENLKAGSIRLFAARRCHAIANEIVAPDDSIYPPIGMGPVGVGVNQRCKDNKVAHNKIDYSPVAAAPAIFEDGTVSPFVTGEVNTVCGNTPISGNGLATEFQPSAASSSPHYAETVWFP